MHDVFTLYKMPHFPPMPKFKYIKEHLFQILAVLTIGFPFVGYKILAGVVIHRLYENPAADILALIFIVWGLIDLILNAICFHAVCWRGHTHYPFCLFSVIARRHPILSKWDDAGEALDVMLSFTIVAWIVGQGLFSHMDGAQIKIWNICTVVNVLGAGISRLGATVTSKAAKKAATSNTRAL